MAAIPLDRRFFEWSEDKPSDPELRSFFRSDDDADTDWADLLQKRRVVILAEAGSGKTEEMKDQARHQREAGKFAFYASVQDVGRNGFTSSLVPTDRAPFAAWQASGELAWFFIDSVDEAKLDGVRLDQALREIANAIYGAEGRAHVVLSGRHTDWEFRRDLKRFDETLPIPQAPTIPSAPSPDEMIVKTIRNEHKKEPAAAATEKPVVVLMKSLDRRRVRLFADAKGATNVDNFLAQIEAANLWRFARRPLDLEWMVQFWTMHGRLGSLREMLESSLTERLREPNQDRVRADSIDLVRAFEAIERVGAALVLGRARTIAIPDSDLTLSPGNDPPVNLDQVLPDWSTGDRARLLSRPVFDPATFGRARLHNDNEGVVSAYLTARWLERLRRVELSRQGVFDLLFAEQYGVELVKPSMRETAAWLSTWDEDVAREVVRRNTFLLLTAGDPASLPAPLRRSLLVRLTSQIVSGASVPLLDGDSVKRFSRPDITETVRWMWSKHKDHPEIRSLVLRLIWLGELKDCADIAAEAAFKTYSERSTALFAGRALVATGDDASKRRYVAHVKAGLGTIQNAVVWHAVESLFPIYLGIDDLLDILAAIDVTDSDGGLGFEWGSRDLIGRVQTRPNLERLLAGLLMQLGGSPGSIGHTPTAREKAYFQPIGAAADRLLEMSGDQEAPMIAIDAVLRLGENRQMRQRARKAVGEARAELVRTSARRRLVFWRAGERLSGHPMMQGRPLESVWEMEVLGLSPALTLDDIDWILADAVTRTTEQERRLAINAAMKLWRENGEQITLRDRIKTVADQDPAMKAAFDAWLKPRTPSAQEKAMEAEHRRVMKRHDRQRAIEDKGWQKFAADIRADPQQLRQPPSDNGVDWRLYNLWTLLSASVDQNSRYAVESVALLEPMIGADATSATRDGLIAHWRAWQPRRISEREVGQRNTINNYDCMGIVGVTLEAATVAGWANNLSHELAQRAAIYATLELNGFPNWIEALAREKPDEVREVLVGEIVAELDHSDEGQQFEVLGDAANADQSIAQLLARPVLDELEKRQNINDRALPRMLDIIVKGLFAADRDRFIRVALDRFKIATKLETSALYVSALFQFDPQRAADALEARLDSLGAADQTNLAKGVLPELFGDGFGRSTTTRVSLTSEILERLVELAYRTIRMAEDRNRPNGVVFSPDDRDHAERARGAAFNALYETPGRSTYDALLRLAKKKKFPIPPLRLHDLARERAMDDSESPPWTPSLVMTFERTSLTIPNTARDLQRVAQSRLAEMQHDLLHSDFAQGKTVSALPNETAVQNWVADRLRVAQGRSYSVEREPHVVEEKEPDVRLRAKATDASLPIEIKVAESWSITELEEALDDQLCGRYLRARESREGILLLVYKRPRAKGWPRKGAAALTFSQVVEHLRARSATIAAASRDAPQPEIAVLDVSIYATRKRKTINASKRKRPKRKAGRARKRRL